MSDFGSLIFYIVSFFLSFICYYFYNKFNKKHNKIIFLVASFLIPLLIGGLRYRVGTDYNNYVNLYRYQRDVDIGFKMISIVSSYLTGYTSLFFIYTFFTLMFIYMGLNNIDRKIRPLAYLCYLFLFFTGSFNIIRQSLAVSIIFYAYKYIINKEFKKWTIFVFIAFCFHSTAIICLPFYIVLNNKSNKIKVITVVVTVIIAWNYSKIINYIGEVPFFSHYLVYEKDLKEISNNRMFYIDLMIMIYILFFSKSLIKYNNKNNIYIFLFAISIAFELSGFFNPFVKRIGNYFYLSEIILLSSIPVVNEDNKKQLLNYLLVCSYIITIFVLSTYILKQADIIPYKFIGV